MKCTSGTIIYWVRKTRGCARKLQAKANFLLHSSQICGLSPAGNGTCERKIFSIPLLASCQIETIHVYRNENKLENLESNLKAMKVLGCFLEICLKKEFLLPLLVTKFSMTCKDVMDPKDSLDIDLCSSSLVEAGDTGNTFR
ncbi:hypothetical protein GQX74_005646 [Glossina fuscipes]|nr:hypothetical protein GQX74_005646 [Glossina fuscipes]